MTDQRLCIMFGVTVHAVDGKWRVMADTFHDATVNDIPYSDTAARAEGLAADRLCLYDLFCIGKGYGMEEDDEPD